MNLATAIIAGDLTPGAFLHHSVPGAAHFAKLGPVGIHADVLGLAVIGAGPLTPELLAGMYDDERSRYAERTLREFDADQRAFVIQRCNLGGASVTDILFELECRWPQ